MKVSISILCIIYQLLNIYEDYCPEKMFITKDNMVAVRVSTVCITLAVLFSSCLFLFLPVCTIWKLYFYKGKFSGYFFITL